MNPQGEKLVNCSWTGYGDKVIEAVVKQILHVQVASWEVKEFKWKQENTLGRIAGRWGLAQEEINEC